MRVPKGLLRGFRASRVPLGIDRMGFASRKHWEIAKMSEINENGAANLKENGKSVIALIRVWIRIFFVPVMIRFTSVDAICY